MRSMTHVRRWAAAACAAVLGLTGLVLAAPSAQAFEETDVVRVAGADRYATAAEAATTAYPGGATDVVLASGQSFPDALAAGGLAGSLDAPILLTASDSLPASTADALQDLGATDVTVMGGPSAVSQDVEDALVAAGYAVDRIAGASRFETAANTAAEVGGTTVVLANGMSYADALAISPGAHAMGLPILLTPADVLAPAAGAHIADAGVAEVVIVGGTAAVSQAVEDELVADGLAVERLGGANRYATGVAIAQHHLANGFEADEVVLATGESFADALAGGPLASSVDGPLVLTQTATLTPDTATFLEGVAADFDALSVLGGTAAVADAVADAAAAAGQLDGVPTFTDLPELVSATTHVVDDTVTTVRFTFDEPVDGAPPVVPGFDLVTWYDFDDVQATSVAVDASDPASVIAVFPTDGYERSTRAAVSDGTVTDRDGDGSPMDSVPLRALEIPGGRTSYDGRRTDLVGVELDAAADEVTYTFSDDTHLTSGDTIDNANAFAVLLEDGTVLGNAANVAVTVSADGTELTVPIDGGLSDAQVAEARRAYTEPDIAHNAGSNVSNLPLAVDLNGGSTDNPDIVSVEYHSQVDPSAARATADHPTSGGPADIVEITYDEAVSIDDPTAFVGFRPDGSTVASAATSTRTKGGDDTTVVYTLPRGDTRGLVGIYVLDGAVASIAGAPRSSDPDTVGRRLTFAAGDTQGPELVDIDVEVATTDVDVVTGEQTPATYRITLTWNEPIEVAPTYAGLALYQADGSAAQLLGTGPRGFTSGDTSAVYETHDTDGARAQIENAVALYEECGATGFGHSGFLSFQPVSDCDLHAFPGV